MYLCSSMPAARPSVDSRSSWESGEEKKSAVLGPAEELRKACYLTLYKEKYPISKWCIGIHLESFNCKGTNGY